MKNKVLCLFLFFFLGIIPSNGQIKISYDSLYLEHNWQINVSYDSRCEEYNSLILCKLVVDLFGETFVDSMLLNLISFDYQIEINSKGKAISTEITYASNYDRQLLTGLGKKIIGQRFYYCSRKIDSTPKHYLRLEKEFALRNQYITASFSDIFYRSFLSYKQGMVESGKNKTLPYHTYIKKRIREYKPTFKYGSII